MITTAEPPKFCLLQHLVVEKLEFSVANILIQFHLLLLLAAILELEAIRSCLGCSSNTPGGLIHLVTFYGDFGGFNQMLAA